MGKRQNRRGMEMRPNRMRPQSHPHARPAKAPAADKVSWAALYIDWESIEDDYEHGESIEPGSSRTILAESIFMDAPTPDALIKKLSSRYGVPENRDAWSAFDDRLECSLLVDDDNLEATPRDVDAWKEGKKRLWSAHVSVYVALVSTHRPSTEEIAKAFGVEDMGGSE